MKDIFLAGQRMMQPYDIVTNGKIYVSLINNPGRRRQGAPGKGTTGHG